jgi:hypothetical protein
MFIKENFWVGVKGGLIEERHYYAMRDAVWLFLWLVLRQTGINEAGEGVVKYGHPVTRKEITENTGFADWRVERWIDRLRRTDYIRTQKSGNDGLIFFVLAGKHKTKRDREAANMLPPVEKVTTNMLPPDKSAATYPIEDKKVSMVGGNTSTKDLSYYNKSAAAKPAAGISLSKLAKAKSIPRAQKSQKELDEERRRQLDAMRAKGYLQ